MGNRFTRARQRTTNFDDLPENIAVHILLQAAEGSGERRAELCCVCRSWHRLLATSDMLWTWLALDGKRVAEVALDDVAQWQALGRFLACKAGSTRHFLLRHGEQLAEAGVRKLLELLQPLLTSAELESLSLSGVHAELLVAAACSATGIKRLALAGSPLIDGRYKEFTLKLESLDPLAAALPHLQQLCIDWAVVNHKLRLHTKLWQLSHLTSLRLRCDADLAAPPVAMSGLVALQQLDLRAMSLGALPPSVSGLAALTSVRIEAIRMKTSRNMNIFDSLHQLPNLARVVISRVQLGYFPHKLQLINGLQELRLEELPWAAERHPQQGVTRLPASLDGCWAHLTCLGLSHIGQSLPPGWGKSLTALQHLNLCMGGNTRFEPGCLSGLTNLRSCSIDGSYGGFVSPGVWKQFKVLTQLTKLKLRSWLQEIPGGPHLRRLQVLDLSDNELVEIPPCLRTATALQSLSLASNYELMFDSKALYTVVRRMPNLTRLDLRLTAADLPARSYLHMLHALHYLAHIRPELQVALGRDNRLSMSMWEENMPDMFELDRWQGVGGFPTEAQPHVFQPLGTIDFPALRGRVKLEMIMEREMDSDSEGSEGSQHGGSDEDAGAGGMGGGGGDGGGSSGDGSEGFSDDDFGGGAEDDGFDDDEFDDEPSEEYSFGYDSEGWYGLYGDEFEEEDDEEDADSDSNGDPDGSGAGDSE